MEKRVNRTRRIRTGHYAIALIAAWTTVVGGLFSWTISRQREGTRETAQAEARAHFQRDKMFRHWVASHGGIYVPVKQDTPPSPYLSHLPHRDVTRPDGTLLTLMNPAYTLRQMNEQILGLKTTFGTVWVLGLVGILWGAWIVQRRMKRQAEAEQALTLREATLKRSETKFRTLYDSTSDAVMLLDKNAFFFDCNEAALRIFRCKDKAEFCTKHPADLSPAEQPCGTDSTTLANQQTATAARDGSNHFEWIHKRLDTGETFPADVLLNAMELDGQPMLQAVVRDISERKQAEQVLRKSEERFRDIFNTSADAILVFDTEGIITWANPAAWKMYGYTEEEMIGLSGKSIVSPDHYWLFAEFKKQLAGTGQFHAESVDVRKDGTRFDVEVHGSSLHYKSEPHLLAIVRDVTERKRVHSEREQFSRILEDSLNEIFIFDTDTLRFLDVNRGARENLGYSIEELREMTALDIKPEVTEESFEEMVKPLRLGTRQKIQFTTIHRRKDGSLYPVEVHLQMSSCSNTVFVAIILDITKRSQAEEQLNGYIAALESANKVADEFREAAEAANRAKSAFLANMSHEIRTPMTAILGFTDVLLGEAGIEKAPPERAGALEIIKRNGVYLLEMINDILDLSKIEAGKLDVERIDCSPSDVVNDVASLMRVRAQAKGLPLEIEYVSEIPKTIPCDPTRLRQILINLLGNAIKFTETGSVRLVTRLVQGAARPPILSFDVIDSGIGLNQEQAAKLFQPFTQADASTTRKFGGTGLGLTISKRLAELLGGNITFSSNPGKGSTFSLTIETGSLDNVPMLKNVTEASVTNSQNKPKASPISAIKLSCRILLAEDGPDNQRLISFLLKKAGAEVVTADNGLIAHDLALAARDEGASFDVILMDMQMPVMDGYDATSKLRQANYSGPIIALTAHAMNTDREKCLSAGCNDYATKPIDHKKLISLVAEYTSGQELHKEHQLPSV